MRSVFTIWRREISACFLSPIAYVTMIVFLLLSSWTFWNAVSSRIGAMESLPFLMTMSILFWFPVLVAVVTMRLFAEERRSGTLETLLTAPVTEAALVAGKYAGSVMFLIIVIAPAFSSIYILARLSPGIQSLDGGALAGGMIIVMMMTALCASIGLLISIVTKNQIIAFICCFCGILIPLVIGRFIKILPFGSDILVDYLSLEIHLLDFSKGSVDMRPVVLYATLTVFFLFVSVRVLESRRWR